MGVYTHTEGNWFSRRGNFLVLLIAFHILLLWALKSGFAVKFLEVIAPPIKVEVVKEIKPEEPPPPPPSVKPVEVPPVSVPPVLVDIVIPVEPPIQVAPAPPVPPGPPVVAGPANVGVGNGNSAGKGPPGPAVVAYQRIYTPNTDDFYPDTSRTLEEEGRPIIKVCFDAAGKVKPSDVTLAESSGKPRLDKAAIKVGEKFKYKAGTVDGKPVADCQKVGVVFKMK